MVSDVVFATVHTPVSATAPVPVLAAMSTVAMPTRCPTTTTAFAEIALPELA